MSDKVSEFYEDKKNVDEMQNWNSTLKEWETNREYYFFRDCIDFNDVKIRYHSLMMTYHPDISKSDEETAKEINRQYEEIKRKCG